MKQFVDADNQVPEDPQVAFVDGYAVGERLLEGVLFKVTLDEHGEFVCEGVRDEDQEYFSDFSKKKQTQWCEEILKDLDQGIAMLVSEDGRDVDVVDEIGAVVPPKNPRQPIEVHAFTVGQSSKDSIAAKEFSDLVGLTIAQAEKRARNRGIESIRAVFIDGDAQFGTADLRNDRLNVATEDGKISAITGVG